MSVIAFVPLLLALAPPQAARPNVLFIAVDDLRPELGAYGNRQVKTPNIDALAARGTLFLRAYAQQAVCNPSRASLMTGKRPDTLGVYDLPTHFRDRAPDAVTVAQHFKAHGYHTERVGKIFHIGHGNHDDEPSWSTTRPHPEAPRYGGEGGKVKPRGPAWEAPEVDDDALTDGSTAKNAIAILEEVRDRPFFLAVGFLNPHLPFVAPKKYWDLYAEQDIRLARNPMRPKDAPAYAGHDSGELRQYHGIPPRGPLSEAQARKMVHGYRAAVSYTDALVGRLLGALDRLGLRERTIVVLWGDHGWHLGEHGMWCKHSNYEVAARVPLVVSVPGQKARGARSPALVELVDLFPTLAEAARLPLPPGLEGTSLRPLLDRPTLPWKRAAFHLYPRQVPGVGAGMGRAIRTDRYRLVEWTVPEKGFVEHELYDLKTDPDEDVNLARSPRQTALVKRLAGQLHAGWKAALPGE